MVPKDWHEVTFHIPFSVELIALIAIFFCSRCVSSISGSVNPNRARPARGGRPRAPDRKVPPGYLRQQPL
jgi:hypothetical protein